MSTSGDREPSCPPTEATENGDDASGQRPLKKARFAWQVKGRQADSGEGSSSSRVLNPASSASRDRELPSNWMAPSVVERRLREQRCLEAWQERQMAKVILDNSVNDLLDQFHRTNGTASANINSLNELEPDADASVENEGILMAISAHGLRQMFEPRAPPRRYCGGGGGGEGGFCCHTRRLGSASPPDLQEVNSFMEAAVSFVIHQQGLTPLGFEFV